jgi:hypothetical protein
MLPLHDVEGAAVDGSGDDALGRQRPDGGEQECEAEGLGEGEVEGALHHVTG